MIMVTTAMVEMVVTLLMRKDALQDNESMSTPFFTTATTWFKSFGHFQHKWWFENKPRELLIT